MRSPRSSHSGHSPCAAHPDVFASARPENPGQPGNPVEESTHARDQRFRLRVATPRLTNMARLLIGMIATIAVRQNAAGSARFGPARGCPATRASMEAGRFASGLPLGAVAPEWPLVIIRASAGLFGPHHVAS